MIRRIARCAAAACLAVFAALAFSPHHAQGMEKQVVFIKAFYPLDEPRFHCIDIPGHRDRVRTTAALVVHTCKEGIWNLDGQFDPAAVKKGMLRMPEYDLCVAAGLPDRRREARAQKMRRRGSPELALRELPPELEGRIPASASPSVPSPPASRGAGAGSRAGTWRAPWPSGRVRKKRSRDSYGGWRSP